MEDEDFIMEEPDWDKINAEIHAEQQEQKRNDTAILEHVKQLVSSNIYQQIQEEIKESEYAHHFKIVDTPSGYFQDRSNEYDSDEIVKVWIDQYSGYFGDDYHGTVSIELPDGKYLHWSYEM